MRQGRTLQGRKAPRVQAGSASQSDRIHRMACCRPDASNPPRNGAVSRCRPGPPAIQGQGHSRVRRQGTGASDGGRFCFTDQRESLCLRRCWVSSAGVGPHCQRPRRCAPYQVGLRGLRAATRCRPGPSAVRRRSRSRARTARAGESRFELELNGSEPIVLPGYTIPHWVGEEGFEPSRREGTGI